MAVTTDPTALSPEVYSADDLARATGASPAEIAAWVEAGVIRTLPAAAASGCRRRRPFARVARSGAARSQRPCRSAIARPGDVRRADRVDPRLQGTPGAVEQPARGSGRRYCAGHDARPGRRRAVSDSEPVRPEKMRLVYLALPGPGGGGGGGGLKQKLPPPKARREGTRHIDSPLPVRETPVIPEPQPTPPDPEPPKVEPEPLPPVEAPVVAIAADNQTQSWRARAVAGRDTVSRCRRGRRRRDRQRRGAWRRRRLRHRRRALAAAQAEGRTGLAAASSRRRC